VERSAVSISGEPVVLDLEMDLPVLIADGEQIMFPVVEKLVSSGLATAAGEVGKLVVAVEMNAKVLVPRLISVQQFLVDIGNAGGGHDGRHHVLQREDAIEHLTRLDLSRPAYQERGAEAALPS
jgi:hypothetical protein